MYMYWGLACVIQKAALHFKLRNFVLLTEIIFSEESEPKFAQSIEYHCHVKSS